MLCSDGLFNEVDEGVLAHVLASVTDPADAANELVRLANEGGGRDNITVLVVDVVADEGHAQVAAAPAAAVADEAPAGPPSRVPAVETSDGRGAPRADRDSLARRAVESWRVLLFALALAAVVLVAVIAWLVLRDDDPAVLDPPVPSTTTAVDSTSTSTLAVATTTITTTAPSVTAGPDTPTTVR
jgi:hypothetical protein